MAGSAAGWSHYRFGGFVHEVEAMAAAGMGAVAALSTGPLQSACAMGLDRSMGSLKVGK